jgi:hypothetical protein
LAIIKLLKHQLEQNSQLPEFRAALISSKGITDATCPFSHFLVSPSILTNHTAPCFHRVMTMFVYPGTAIRDIGEGKTGCGFPNFCSGLSHCYSMNCGGAIPSPTDLH